MTKTKILISYARADSLSASARLRDELHQAGYEVWRDVEEMRGGKDWKEQLRQAIKSVDVVVVLLTPAAVISKYVLWECDTAETFTKPVIGLLMIPCTVPDELAHLHYHDLSVTEKYSLGLVSLIRDLNELKPVSMPNQENPKSGGSKFNFSGGQIHNSQIGDGNTMYNNAAPNSGELVQTIIQILKTDHQQLRAILVKEITQLNADQTQQIKHVMQSYRHGQLSTADVNQFMQTMQALVTQLQDGSLSAQNQLVQISQQLEEVYSSSLSQQHQFELTLPIIPMFVNYKYTFGGAFDINLHNLFDQLKQSWDTFTR